MNDNDNDNEKQEPADLMMEQMDWLDEEWEDEGDLRDRWEPRDDEVENLIDHADFEED